MKITRALLPAIVLFSQLAGADTSPLIDQVKQLVEINSGSANTVGVSRIQNLIAEQLKILGFEVELRKDQLLIGTLQGKSPKTITLLVHADTVFEPSSPFQHFSQNGNTATGPGIIDDKGGVVVALEGVKRYLKGNPPAYTLKFISSPAEETGLSTVYDTFRKLATDSWLILGFEPALADGSIIESRRGARWYNISVIGKEAHAGRAHKDGVNACNALAEKISAISKLTNYSRNVTVSVGHMEGGRDKYNIVCGEAHAKLDTRFATFSDRDALHKKIEHILNRSDVPGAKTSYELVDDSPPFSASKTIRPFIEQYLSAIQKVENKKVKSDLSGGSADSNYFSKKDALIIDGLGPQGGKIHTADEFLVVSSLETRAEALNQFLRNLK